MKPGILVKTIGGAVAALLLGAKAEAETATGPHLITPANGTEFYARPVADKNAKPASIKGNSCVEVVASRAAQKELQRGYVLVSVKENPNSSGTRTGYVKKSALAPAPNVKPIDCKGEFGTGAMPAPPLTPPDKVEEKPFENAPGVVTRYTLNTDAPLSKKPDTTPWFKVKTGSCVEEYNTALSGDTHIYVALTTPQQSYFGYIPRSALAEKGPAVSGEGCRGFKLK